MTNKFILTAALGLGGITVLCADPTPSSVGSVWGHATNVRVASEAPATSIFGDPTAHSVGDLVTIIVDLQNTVTKDANTKTSKTAAVQDAISSLVYPPDASNHGWSWYTYHGQTPQMAWSANHSFTGGGTVANDETDSTTIQARVIRVAINGVMTVEATRLSKAGDEDTSMILTGLVRPEDLGQDNSISSSRVADLQILQKGKGTLTEDQRKGWLTKIYEFLSPF
jgi:flagellar L-ring protein precursor FlgH